MLKLSSAARSSFLGAFALAALCAVSGCDDDHGGDGASTTTSSLTGGGSTTTTFSGTTSTTLGGGGTSACSVTWRVTNAVTLGALQFDTDYSGAPGGFVGAADAVQCSDQTGSLASFHDNEGTSVLSAGLINLTGFDGPRNIARCEFRSTGEAATIDDFVVTVIDATDPSLTPVTADVEVILVDCVPGGNTTLPPGTTSTTTTTTTLPGVPFTVAINLDDAITIGSLQLDIDYSQADGSFVGSADLVECENLSGSELSSFHDRDGQQTLGAGFVDTEGVTGPLPLAACAFRTLVGVPAPVPSDFVVNTIDATLPDLTPITPPPAIGIVVTEVTTTTTTTTSITLDPSFVTVGFSVQDDRLIGALQVAVDYSQAQGSFVGSGPEVDCLDRSGSLSSFNDVEDPKTLSAGFINLAGIDGPRLIFECSFAASAGVPAPSDFDVTVVDATSINLTPIVPPPVIVVSVEFRRP